MNRSGVSKNTRKNNNKDKFNPKSNPIIAKHWDPELTAKQNYKKLGLTFKLASASGGEEKKIRIKPIQHGNMEESLYDASADEAEQADGELDPYDPANILEGTAKMVKDDEGRVVKIIYGTKRITAHAPAEEAVLSDVGDADDAAEAEQVISELEQLAQLPKKKEVHKMNELEIHRFQRLVEKYADDYEKMKWDRKLNPFQLSPGQLRKQIKRYLDVHGDGA